MSAIGKSENLHCALEALAQVISVEDIIIEDSFIKHMHIKIREIGSVAVQQLVVNDTPDLFEFYSKGLSEMPRHMFAPYPLFHTPPRSANELAERIAEWQKENDWTALSLVKDKRIIGFCLLKRFCSEQATSSIVVRDEFLKQGLGGILQTIIVEQARLLNLPGFHVKIVSDNIASVRLHEKCGFRQTKILLPPLYEEILQYLSARDKEEGRKAEERHIVEMVIKF